MSIQLKPKPYKFDPKDEFYLCPPMCGLIHYRVAAVIAGLTEIFLLGLTVLAFSNLHLTRNLTELWTLISVIAILVIACFTTTIMMFGIKYEIPACFYPQLYFLNVEIFLLLIASAGSIASMSLGIESTHKIFSPFVSVPDMEENFGPIWPFCIAIVAFTGAALGIWFHLTIQGCYDYILDKKYFDKRTDSDVPMELQQKIEAEEAPMERSARA